MNYIKQTVKEELLFTEEAANYLGISKQRLSVLVKEKRIIPVKHTCNGMLFWLQDLAEFRLKKIKSNKLKSLVGITSTSLDFYFSNKSNLGEIYQVNIYFDELDAIKDNQYEQSDEELGNGLYRIDVPLMSIKGSDNEMWLGGCTCGYSGTGPKGSLKILKDLGIKNADENIDNKIIEYYKINGEWKLTVKKDNTILDKIDNNTNIKFYIKNNKLILVQDNQIKFNKNHIDVIKLYQEFMPNPYSIIIFPNFKDAIENGYYLKSYEYGQTIPFQLIIEDKQGNQIWLPYFIDEYTDPYTDINIKQILDLCGFPVKEISQIDSIKNWINLNIFNKPHNPIKIDKE